MKRYLAAIFIALSVLLSPVGVSAAGACPPDTILAIPAWYKDMQDRTNCGFKPITYQETSSDGTVKDKIDVVKTSVRVGMNVLQAALVVAGYVAVIMIIRGGFAYMLSAGDSSGVAGAKKTITNAVIGLVIAVLSASIVNAVAGLIK